MVDPDETEKQENVIDIVLCDLVPVCVLFDIFDFVEERVRSYLGDDHLPHHWLPNASVLKGVHRSEFLD